MIPPPPDLPGLLRSACCDRPDRSSVNELVALASRLARAYLRSRHVASGEMGGLASADDVALDLVADLFGRDSRGRFTALRAAFADVSGDPDVAFSRFRRVVFGRIAEGIFDQYRANDPEFARIIRNLKAAAQRAGIRVEAVHGARWLVFDDDMAGRPTITPEILEALLTGRLREGMTADQILSNLGDILTGQDGYRPAVPVVLAARAVRSSWNRLHRDALLESVRVETDEGAGDGFDSLRSVALSRVRTALRPSYVQSGKLDRGTFETYLSIVERQLAAEVEGAGEPSSLYERFRQIDPGLDRREYNARHRARLEYFWRCARDAMARNVRIELGLSANPSDCKE